jgi:hypothetical protein
MFDVCNLINRFKQAGLVLKKAAKAFGSNEDVFGIDIKRSVNGVTRNEWFEVWPGHETNRVEVVGMDSNIQQLVLLVKEEKRKFTETIKKSRWGSGKPNGTIKETENSWVVERITPGNSRRFLMGVDERQLFMCQLRGSINSAKAKWEQEVIKAREVTKAEQEKKVAETAAEQRKNVATFDLESAKLKKDTEIALGEGESKRKQLVMAADGALEKKLEAYIKVNELYAKAIGDYKGNWVPTIQTGSGPQNGVSQNGATDLINLLTAKTAKDLALDLSIPNQQVKK